MKTTEQIKGIIEAMLFQFNQDNETNIEYERMNIWINTYGDYYRVNCEYTYRHALVLVEPGKIGKKPDWREEVEKDFFNFYINEENDSYDFMNKMKYELYKMFNLFKELNPYEKAI